MGGAWHELSKNNCNPSKRVEYLWLLMVLRFLRFTRRDWKMEDYEVNADININEDLFFAELSSSDD